MNYSLNQMAEKVLAARNSLKPIHIRGGGSKTFYGNPNLDVQEGDVTLDMTSLNGIVTYEPSELVLTAMAGTPLSEIKDTLADSGQMLPFDPPEFGAQATIGGCVAAGLSGPNSFAAGPLRHYVLGTQLLDAEGRVLTFGGEVMKNVAGYDVPRLLTGSMGIFGAIVRVSIKVMPVMRFDQTLQFDMTEAQALERCKGLRALAMPIKCVAWLPNVIDVNQQNASGSEIGGHDANGTLSIRLAGAEPAVALAIKTLGGKVLTADAAKKWWHDFREQRFDFFTHKPIWRLAVAANTPALNLGSSAFDLAGEVRWLAADIDAQTVRDVAARAGGHATLFKREHLGPCPADGVFHPMSVDIHGIVKRLKHEFDPHGLFNPGRLVLGL
jgi:glycolate oxidase FAD binding subunit